MKPQIVPRSHLEEGQHTEPRPALTQGSHARHETRVSLLVEAARLAPKAGSVAIFCRQVRNSGLSVTVRDVERELQYLLDREMIVEVPQLISPEIRLYRIHANGTDYLAEQGIEE